MLSKQKRVSKKLFNKIIAEGIIFHSNFFIVRCVKGQNESRFAVSVPKKVVKKAVLKNKIRRRTYSLIKSFKSRLKSGFYILIIMKSGAEKLSFGNLKDEIEKIFVKSGVLK